MTIGETIEVCAIWLSGTETPEQRRQFEADVAEALKATEAQRERILGPVSYVEKRPGEPRVPDVPRHIAGPDVRLLVGEAMVLGLRLGPRTAVGFVHDLEPDDHALLRRITRQAYERRYPGYARLTDRQCDTLINDLGPEAALAAMRATRRSDLH